MSGCQHPAVVGFDGWEIEKDKGTITIKIETGHTRTVKIKLLLEGVAKMVKILKVKFDQDLCLHLAIWDIIVGEQLIETLM